MQQPIQKKPDIFDRIMAFPVLRIFQPFYAKHKEVLMYLLFGGLAFFLNIGLYAILNGVWGMNELVANAICWVICVIFQFITNRTWVFNSHADSLEDFVKQMASFFGGRIFTLVVEELILAVFITWLKYNSLIVKMAGQIAVIVLNYIISKFFVFKEAA